MYLIWLVSRWNHPSFYTKSIDWVSKWNPMTGFYMTETMVLNLSNIFRHCWLLLMLTIISMWIIISIFEKQVRLRSSYRRCSVRKGVLRDFAKFTENTSARFFFLINLQAWHKTPLGDWFRRLNHITNISSKNF